MQQPMQQNATRDICQLYNIYGVNDCNDLICSN